MTLEIEKVPVAVVVDWLVVYSGGEAVLKCLLELLPQADIYCLVDFLPEKDRGFLKGHKVTTSFLQSFPWAKTKYRQMLPFMPLAIEQFDLSSYPLVISSSHAVAKGVITGPLQMHISYILSPIRYAWDLQHQYMEESGLTKGIKSWVARFILHYIRLWDLRTVASVDLLIADSHFIARRIYKLYRREAEVIHPPIACEDFHCQEEKGEYYFTSSRFVPYKKINLIIEAFNQMPDKKLIVSGDGPDKEKLEALAGPNVSLVEKLSFQEYKKHLSGAKAFIHAALEDFGIVMVESLASGTPVIAYGKGGSQDIVTHGKTGFLFEEQTVSCLKQAVMDFEQGHFLSSAEIAHSVQSFSVEKFKAKIREAVNKGLQTLK